MANTYTQIYLHIVFAVKNSNSLIPCLQLNRIHAYMGGVLREQGHYPMAIGGIENHVHILIGYNVNISIPDTVRNLKTSTSRFINDLNIIPFRFEWQRGYGCFSYSRSHVDNVINYIKRQHEHHKSRSLEEEMRNIMDRFGIDYDERYMIKDPV